MKRADIVSVRGLLSGNARYRPSTGHRGFSWTPAEVAQLLVDLELSARNDEDEDDEFAPDERFYLGVIAVQPARNGLYTLVDGAQRLATLALLLAFARDRIDDGGERQRIDRMLVRRSLARPPEPRIRLTPEDHAWYSHFILPQGATRRLPSQSPLGSPRELLMAARFMEQAFADYDQDDLWRLSGFVSYHAAVVRSVAQPGATWSSLTLNAPSASAEFPAPPQFQSRFPPQPPFPPEPPRPSHYGVAAE
ncbi:MAG TPA: DUF262 domain-containing protein [Hyphomonadaceae bacterium]|jgi:hypothetical protein|nr:DUF262 domain-containing protein [Hyphomonadaceae bacterium]